jgi:hypothetical protein
MGSSPIWLRVIHEHGSGKAVQTLPWPSVLELRVLITLGPETVERLLSSRPQSGASPSAMTHHDLDLSICFPFIISLCPPFHSHHLYYSHQTLDPGCADTIVLPYSHPELNCPSPGQVFFQPSLFIHLLFPHSPLSLSARAVSHAIVSDFGCTARLVCHRAQPPPMFPPFSFMPHSYALYPDDSHVIVTHPLCSLYAIGPSPSPS